MRPSGAALIAVVLACVAILEAQSAPVQAPVTIRTRVVADDSNEPISAARVQLRGVDGARRTGADGQFAIEADPNATLIITKAGFVRFEQSIGALQGRDIRLTRAAVLSGRVADPYGEPVMGADVIASSPELSQQATTTDDRGEYRLGNLAPGTYRIAVRTTGLEETRSDSVSTTTSGVRFAGLRPATYTTHFPDSAEEANATPIAVRQGEWRSGLDFQVPLEKVANQRHGLLPIPERFIDARPPLDGGATIRGTVSDTNGRPLPYALMTLDGTPASTPRVLEPEALTRVYRTVVADERGQFEFTGLRRGRYAVHAAKAGYSDAARGRLPGPLIAEGQSRAVNLTLTPLSVVSGTVRDDVGDPVHGATVTLLQSRYERGRRRLVAVPISPRPTDDRGEFRVFAVPPGDYVVMARTRGDADTIAAYAPSFYPGTLSGGDAAVVTVTPGADVGGVDFALISERTVRVSGIAFDPSGVPTAQLQVSLISTDGLGAVLEADIDGDGSFVIERVPPGRYLLRADAGRTNTFTEGPFAAMPIAVGSSDITDVRVQASAGSTITGRLVFNRQSGSSDPPPTAVTISAIPADFDAAPSFIASAQANAAHVFQLRGITGTRRLQVTRLPPQYAVSAILANGRDISDEPLSFGSPAQSLDDVQVVLTDRVSTLTVRVLDGRQPAGAGVHVLMFSTDPARLYPQSRHQTHQTTGAEGAFTVTGLRAGDYFAAAVRSIPEGNDAWRDPAFLDALLGSATVISVRDGETSTATLRLLDGP